MANIKEFLQPYLCAYAPYLGGLLLYLLLFWGAPLSMVEETSFHMVFGEGRENPVVYDPVPFGKKVKYVVGAHIMWLLLAFIIWILI